MKALLVTIAGVILAFVASVLRAPWLAAAASLVAICGAYAQFRAGQPFELMFSDASWRESDGGFSLSVPRAMHKKVRPTATVFEGVATTFHWVGVSIQVSDSGNVELGAATRFTGKVVIV